MYPLVERSVLLLFLSKGTRFYSGELWSRYLESSLRVTGSIPTEHFSHFSALSSLKVTVCAMFTRVP